MKLHGGDDRPQGALPAADIYHWRMVGEISDPAELARLRKALLEYCLQDTLGLVRLLEKMRSMEGEDGKGYPHIHVERGKCYAKFWLDPVSLARSRGFRNYEIV